MRAFLAILGALAPAALAALPAWAAVVPERRASEPSTPAVRAAPSEAVPVPPEPLAEPLVLRAGLAVTRTGRGGRVPFPTDAVEAALARGDAAPPTAGAPVVLPSGETRAWEPVEAGAGGRFPAEALRGGWLSVRLESPRERVLLLDARGHRAVRVDGAPRGGDLYDLGLVRPPIVLKAGATELRFRAGRGSLAAALVEPPAPVFLEERDRTSGDLLIGEEDGAGRLRAWCGIVVANATREALTGWTLAHRPLGADGVPGPETVTPLPSIGPLATRRVPVELGCPASGRAAGETVRFALSLRAPAGRAVHAGEHALVVKRPSEKHVRSFVSAIDGSVQHYAVTPPASAPSGTRVASATDGPSADGPTGAAASARRPGLVLTLHGASVAAPSQAFAYAPRPGTWIVAPTNRRPFGFDWEDWGRLDALEVLALAEARFGTDPRRTWLTGHSMGGHGTWSLGVHAAGRFAAIAPSAGWRDFWSYGGAGEPAAPTPVETLLARAANGSRTLLLERNLEPTGVYVLHGDADDNVPVSQARFMRERLGAFHPDFAYDERPGAGHWWGNQCMDWPPLMEFLERHELPAPHAVRRVAFTTVSPGINASCHWVTVHAQERSMEPSRVEARLEPARADEPARIAVTTENVARLALDLGAFTAEREGEGEPPVLAPDAPLALVVDGVELALAPASLADGVVRLTRGAESGWTRVDGFDPDAKSPARCGPFKDAFRHRMVLVHGTAGDDAEDAWSYARARYDAEVFAYRGNGAVDVVPDTAFDPAAEPDRGVILYGNADTNAAWAALLGESPLRVDRAGVTVGERRFEGPGLAALFLRPRPGSAIACVAVIAGTGPAGARATEDLPVFVSGVAYPDWVVLGADVLERGPAGVRAAGFFDERWELGADAVFAAE